MRYEKQYRDPRKVRVFDESTVDMVMDHTGASLDMAFELLEKSNDVIDIIVEYTEAD